MEKLVFVTNNSHKLEEIRKMLEGKIEVISLGDLGCNDVIEETSNTLEGNAIIKARHIHDKYNIPCFADDTGLLVDALDGAPGVYSARYAGEQCDSEANVNKLLSELKSVEDKQRTAKFQTSIALIDEYGEHIFNGEIYGRITTERRGQSGFGYDPVFIPNGYSKTFAEMTIDEKNKISHRALAVIKFVNYLKEYN